MEIEQYSTYRSWWYPTDEVSREATCLHIKGTEERARIYLTRDVRVKGLWNLHFGDLSSLSEEQRSFLIDSVISFLGPSEYLGTTGTSTRGGVAGYKRFFGKLADTGCLRVLHDRNTGEAVYFPILQKL